MAMAYLIPWRRRRNSIQMHRDMDDWTGSLHREMDHLMDRFFSGNDLGPFGWTGGFGDDFRPHVDVSENEKAITVAAELPGMDEKDIDLTLTRDSLTIRGQKKEESERKDEGFHHVERRYGSFHRVIPLSAEVDESKAQAEFKKGVLRITLPKTAEAQQAPKKIAVQTA